MSRSISSSDNWSASDQLSSKVYGATSGDGRSIYIFDSTKASKLNSFYRSRTAFK